MYTYMHCEILYTLIILIYPFIYFIAFSWLSIDFERISISSIFVLFAHFSTFTVILLASLGYYTIFFDLTIIYDN
jgi:hypothetical protein